METNLCVTDSGLAARAPNDQIERQARSFVGQSPMLRPLLDAMPIVVMVLNEQRQLILANKRLLTFLDVPEESLVGLRPGEILSCIHASETPEGCGCAEACGTCGAGQAILSSHTGRANVRECRISRQLGEALDLRICATPLQVGEDSLTIVTAEDISHEKRRRALERVFFHDVLNTATGIRVTANLMRHVAREASAPLSTVSNLLDRLIEEIEVQRQLMAAESGELAIVPESADVTALLYEVAHLYGYGGADIGPRVLVEAPPEPLRLRTDRTLLRRVLGNMVRNAVEASRPTDTVTLGCQSGDHTAEFWVHNPGSMPREVQLQLFQRSFSTKESGRGLGTYSVKLLTERYLGGSVRFASTPEDGTIFVASFPLDCQQ